MLFSKAVLISESAPAAETSKWPQALEEHLKEGVLASYATHMYIKLVLGNYYQSLARCLETVVRFSYTVI